MSTLAAKRPSMGAVFKDWQLAAALSLGPLFWLALAVSQNGAPRVSGGASTLILVVLVFPVFEEIVFRGAVQDFLGRRLGGRSGAVLSRANLATSILFAAAHVFWRGNPLAGAVFFPSLVFGHFRERHATLASPILLHVFYNAGLFLIFGVSPA
ncbi:MAG TPA: JDVT-CTERM system glutamic-type intramembrane protease [Burkholderiales bacterium]|jgi:membrane protease YdiL (CAAX protease family)